MDHNTKATSASEFREQGGCLSGEMHAWNPATANRNNKTF